MLGNFVQKVKGFLLDPVESFRNSREDTFGDAFIYYIVLTVIFSILAGIIGGTIYAAFLSPILGAYTAFAGLIGILVIIIALIIIGAISGLIAPIWLHIWVYLFGGRKGIVQTYKAFFYAKTPDNLLGWIPFVNIIAAIWTFILTILGIRELHEISTLRASMAIIISIIIPIILLTLFAGYFMIVSSSVTPVTI